MQLCVEVVLPVKTQQSGHDRRPITEQPVGVRVLHVVFGVLGRQLWQCDERAPELASVLD